jgi:hypothetical protein
VADYQCKEVRALVLIQLWVVSAGEMVAHVEATKLPLLRRSGDPSSLGDAGCLRAGWDGRGLRRYRARPMTSMLMIFEVTQDDAVIVPPRVN